MKGYIDYRAGIIRQSGRKTNDIVLDPYTYKKYFTYGYKDALEEEINCAIPAFLNYGLLITEVQEAVDGDARGCGRILTPESAKLDAFAFV